jgi:non-canonical poly(A) RNA polymerase PAPD5/7
LSYTKFHADAARTAVFSQVSSVIKKCFPDCVVELYGSSATQLCLPNSDLDLSVSGTGGSGAPWSDLAPFLREFGAQNLQVISTSKVPLVKLRDPVYSLNVDISFQTNSAAPSVELVRTWMTQMDRFKVWQKSVFAFRTF